MHSRSCTSVVTVLKKKCLCVSVDEYKISTFVLRKAKLKSFQLCPIEIYGYVQHLPPLVFLIIPFKYRVYFLHFALGILSLITFCCNMHASKGVVFRLYVNWCMNLKGSNYTVILDVHMFN